MVMIGMCSLVKLKDKKILTSKQHKFMAIIPAHNEEEVVANLVESLKEQNYPKELLDIYVIADNCTDRTAEVAEDAGAIVFQRFDPENKTKGHALKWFLKQKIEDGSDYDAFCIFDADNIVMPDFIKVMNQKLCQGEEIVQGYRDIKNPTDSWVSSGYAIFYWSMHRFYHMARYNLGLSPLLNGTGFMVKFDTIKPDGWNTKTLTEDIEFSIQNVIKGRKLGWAVDAVVFDEQPIGFKQSLIQRRRWSVGHMQCVRHCFKDLAVSVKERKSFVNVDALIYLSALPLLTISVILLLINMLATLITEGFVLTSFLMTYSGFFVGTFMMPVALAVLILWLDKRPMKPMIKGILCFPIFIGSWTIINAMAMIKPDTTWKKIDHVRSVKVNELVNIEKLKNTIK